MPNFTLVGRKNACILTVVAETVEEARVLARKQLQKAGRHSILKWWNENGKNMSTDEEVAEIINRPAPEKPIPDAPEPKGDKISVLGKKVLLGIQDNLLPADPDFSDLTPEQLAAALEMKTASIMSATKALVANGFVTLEDKREEGGNILIHLTAKGWELK